MRRPGTRANMGDAMSLNMTPMIDVVFQLLIFFVCTTNFQVLEELLPTRLKGVGSTTSAATVDPRLAELEEVRIKIDNPAGRLAWEINEQRIGERSQLRPVLVELAQLESALPVTLDVGAEVPLGDMVDVYDLCRLAGFKQIRFAIGDAGPRVTP